MLKYNIRNKNCPFYYSMHTYVREKKNACIYRGLYETICKLAFFISLQISIYAM